MYLECVTVCVNYGDFLAQTLPQNKQHFNHMVVITTPSDKLTQKVCNYHNVEYITTNEFTADGAPFNKAKGINIGLEYLSRKDWVLHLDADIYLPPLTRGILDRISLVKENIYGIDRMMCPNFEQWSNFLLNPDLLHSGWVYIHPTRFPMGVRIGEYMSEGYEPIGYFQLWNPNESGIKLYPEEHGAADRTDVIFAKKWPRAKRALIPEIIGIHLDSENATLEQMGMNWKGRKSKPFGYAATEQHMKKWWHIFNK
jgi:hypothetical protein